MNAVTNGTTGKSSWPAVSRLPYEIIVIILKNLPLDKLHPLLANALVTELRLCLKKKSLQANQHHDGDDDYEQLQRLAKLDVASATTEDIGMMKQICRRCLGSDHDISSLVGVLLDTLAAKLNGGQRIKMTDLEPLNKHPEIFEQVTRLSVAFPLFADLTWLNNICRQGPPKKLNLELGPQVFGLVQYPGILKSLTELELGCALHEGEAQNLDAVCNASTNLSTLWVIAECSAQSLGNRTGIMRSLAGLVFTRPIYEEDIPHLNNICGASVNLSELHIRMHHGLPPVFRDCVHIHPRLKKLGVFLGNEKDVRSFAQIHELCPNLQSYRLVSSISLFKCLITNIRDAPAGMKVAFIARCAVVTGGDSERNLEVECNFHHLERMTNQISNLQQLTRLNLVYDQGLDDNSAFDLLPSIFEKSPNLEEIGIKWITTPSNITVRLFKRLTSSSPQVVLDNLWRKWANAGIRLPKIVCWEEES